MTLPRPLLLTILAAALALVALLGFGVWRLSERLQPESHAGVPGVGGPFSLTATDGRQVTDETFRGQWELVYFGYTHCPDTCPTTLTAISDSLDKLGRTADSVQPLFITVDPARDTEPVMADFVAHFDPRILGLTGPQTEIDKVAHEYGVYVAKHPEAAGSGDYSVDHSAFVFIMDPKGRFAGTFGTQDSAEQIAKRLSALIAKVS